MPSDATDADLVVLGAGPAGLAAAWYASRRGCTVTVVDHAAQVGGLAGSMVVDGQSVDFGSHRLHPSIRADLLADLRVLGVELQWRPRHGRIRLHGRWLVFPLSPSDLLRHASPSFAARVVADMALGPIRRLRTRGRSDRQPVTFEDAVRRGLGSAIYEQFYGPYAHKLWGVDGAALSAELFRRRVSAGSSAKLLRTLLRGGRRRGFWYPVRGFGAICDALAAEVAELGGSVRLDTRIEAIEADDNFVDVALSDGSAIRARRVISTIPPLALARSIGAPSDVVAAAERLDSRAAMLVYLTVPRDRYTDFDAHYLPEATTIVSRVSEPKAYRTSTDDPPHRTVLCAEIPASVGDVLWSTDDDALAARVCRELIELGLPDPSPVACSVVRRTHVYPVYRLGSDADRRLVEAHFDTVPRLTVVGRQATFAHDNTHHALLMGKAVADALDDECRIDPERWATTRLAFADHVVED